MIVNSVLKRIVKARGSGFEDQSRDQNLSGPSNKGVLQAPGRRRQRNPYSAPEDHDSEIGAEPRRLARARAIVPSHSRTLLAPATVEFMIEAKGRSYGKQAKRRFSEKQFQLDQYRVQLSYRTQRSTIPDLSVIETKSEPDAAPANTNIPAIVPRLPVRTHIPSPVRTGKIFVDQDDMPEKNNQFRAGWVNLNKSRR